MYAPRKKTSLKSYKSANHSFECFHSIGARWFLFLWKIVGNEIEIGKKKLNYANLFCLQQIQMKTCLTIEKYYNLSIISFVLQWRDSDYLTGSNAESLILFLNGKLNEVSLRYSFINCKNIKYFDWRTVCLWEQMSSFKMIWCLPSAINSHRLLKMN